jgi:multiple sugar transport system ATP-binding protein
VTIGIRPERVVVNGAEGAAGTGWVYATEPVGSDLFVDVSFDAPDTPDPHLFKIRTRPERSIRAGDRVPVTIPMEYLYVFDKAGRRILSGGGAH